MPYTVWLYEKNPFVWWCWQKLYSQHKLLDQWHKDEPLDLQLLVAGGGWRNPVWDLPGILRLVSNLSLQELSIFIIANKQLKEKNHGKVTNQNHDSWL